MITCEQLYQEIERHGIEFFAGVPDSTFKDWLKFVQAHDRLTHVATANEADAIATVAGYHLATGKFGVAYMQNSGLGNSVNPLTSLADAEVYSLPMLLMIGWRAKPGEKDEPQHRKMGRITLPLLEVLEIPYRLLPDDPAKLPAVWDDAMAHLRQKASPFAIVVSKGIFAPYTATPPKNNWHLVRESAIAQVVRQLSPTAAIVSTTGKISRELYEYRDANSQRHQSDFYTVGSMGCSLSIALGIAMAQPQRQVIVFDADGASLMHLGAWSTVGAYRPNNLKHIVWDNEAYESTGSQPSHSPNVNFVQIALASGYRQARIVSAPDQLEPATKELLDQPGPAMLVIKVKIGSRPDLGRPKTTPEQNKAAFMEFLRHPLEQILER